MLFKFPQKLRLKPRHLKRATGRDLKSEQNLLFEEIYSLNNGFDVNMIIHNFEKP